MTYDKHFGAGWSETNCRAVETFVRRYRQGHTFKAIGKLRPFCSGRWKVEVVDKWLTSRGVGRYQKWIGFSHDEPKRWLKMKASQGEYVRLPLVDDFPTTAEQSVEIVKEMGWPEPPHSSCWMRPNMRDN